MGNVDEQPAFKVGDYARSLETGWLGKIVEIKEETVHVDDTHSFTVRMATMVGVDRLGQMMGLKDDAVLCHDDIQDFSLDDLIPAKD